MKALTLPRREYAVTSRVAFCDYVHSSSMLYILICSIFFYVVPDIIYPDIITLDNIYPDNFGGGSINTPTLSYQLCPVVSMYISSTCAIISSPMLYALNLAVVISLLLEGSRYTIISLIVSSFLRSLVVVSSLAPNNL